jgi:hypothetical protein
LGSGFHFISKAGEALNPTQLSTLIIGFGGLVVSALAKFVGSNPAEAVGFFWRKKILCGM